MAWGNFILDTGLDAAAAITKFRAVKLTAAQTVGPVTAITDVILGFEQFGVTAGEITKGKGASVRVMGVTEAEASGAIAVGALCSLETDGRVKTAATGGRVVGQCVGHPATTAGDRISLLVNPFGALSP